MVAVAAGSGAVLGLGGGEAMAALHVEVREGDGPEGVALIGAGFDGLDC